ncbi:MAG TPA: hypothetical protein VK755_07235 [Candidatus Acidoferrales bacterium]|jgi:Tfp pilus assembly protein PilF|nr:hypothetical protein [Candidatus Acidoferrales bacterium]
MPEPQDQQVPKQQPRSLATLGVARQYAIAIAAIATALAPIWSFVQGQWKLTVLTLVLALLAGALYLVFRRLPDQHRGQAKALKRWIVGLLFATPLLSLTALAVYIYLPNTLEPDVTRIAVARLVGPTLPEPYQDCRPSAMLVHTLSRIGDRFGTIKAFELPYSIDPDARWAQSWAQLHGISEHADVTVYGEYNLYNTPTDRDKKDPDEIVLDPVTTSVPSIPLAYRSAPLYTWDFPATIARIRDLCASDLRDRASSPPRFLDDARRIAASITGLEVLGKHDFATAREADREAKVAESTDSQPCKGDPSSEPVNRDACPGVLAFYLATLDEGLGNYYDATQEYIYAAGKLGKSEPYIDLGELYIHLGATNAAFTAFDSAVDADPTSVAAVATRSQYERDYLRSREAAIDLDRALRLQRKTTFDRFALSRALYQREGKNAAPCAISILQEAIDDRSFDQEANVDTLVNYAGWLRSSNQVDDAIGELIKVLQLDPGHALGNYELGLAYSEPKRHDSVLAESYLRRAEYAAVLTDSDYLTRANAAAQLADHYDTDPSLKRADYKTAMQSYASSIRSNPQAAVTFFDRARLEQGEDDVHARKDYLAAAALNPYDYWIQSATGSFLQKQHHDGEAISYQRRATFIKKARIPLDERHEWSSDLCRYTHLDANQP